MKIILISKKHGGARSVEFGRWSRALVSLCCLGLPLALVSTGYMAGLNSESQSARGTSIDALEDELDQQYTDFQKLQGSAERQLQSMTLNLAQLQARMTRLDALGQHLTAMADLEDGEFDFAQAPALGGPLAEEYKTDFASRNLAGDLGRFAQRLSDREAQLEILESLLSDRKLQSQRSLSGSPVEKGWISSKYGKRTDPFTGKLAMHHGLDFIGKDGSDVMAVAAGVVTLSGVEGSYGNVVEVSHGEGVVTRYAHNRENLVVPGDIVRKGDVIALMGSSGRSTGTHLHYEVYKHGRSVDPSSYVARTRR